jgi:hypothetical protein
MGFTKGLSFTVAMEVCKRTYFGHLHSYYSTGLVQPQLI